MVRAHQLIMLLPCHLSKLKKIPPTAGEKRDGYTASGFLYDTHMSLIPKLTRYTTAFSSELTIQKGI